MAKKTCTLTAAVLLLAAYGCSSHTNPTAQGLPAPGAGIQEYCPVPYFEDAGTMWVCDSGFTPNRFHACDNNGRNAVSKGDYSKDGVDSQTCPSGAQIQIVQSTHGAK
jgi:hypothetical protein